MENEKFKVLNYIRKLLTYIDQNLDNFPKKDIELKNRIRNESYDLLYGNNLFNSNGNNNNNNNRLAPVDSINCGYAIIDCIRDNIETNRCPVDTLNKCHNKLEIGRAHV